MLWTRQVLKHFPVTVLVAVLCVLQIAGPSVAQGPPVQTDNAITLGLEGAAVRFYTEYVSTASGSRVMAPVMVPFDIAPYLLTGLSVPYMSQGGAQQFGNVGLFLKGVPWVEDGPAKTKRIGWMIHVVGNVTSLRAIYTHIHRRLGFYSDATFEIPSLTLTLRNGIGYRLFPEKYAMYPAENWNGYLEWAVRMPGGGGYEITIAPGIQWIPLPNFLYETSLRSPVASNGNPSLQWAVLAGVRWLFVL